MESMISLGGLCARFNLENTMTQLSAGFMDTLFIFFITLVASLPLGLVVSLGRMSKNAVVAI